MLQTIFPEDVINVIQGYVLNKSKSETEKDLAIEIGAEILGISADEMIEIF